ncbi:carboxypeptidase M32 [Rhizosphaericola mali]|nr:carboxypeptidase M32 [Rhizosphaericola mali]
MDSLYTEFVEQSRKIADLQYAAAVLEWDKETYMPAKSAEIRSQQIATLSETAHTWLIDPAYENVMQQLLEQKDLSENELDNVKIRLKEVLRLKKKTPAFVRKMSETVSKAYHKWIEARRKNDFSIYAPALEELINLKKEEAEIYGYEEHPYDALLQEYEESASVEMLDKVFADLLPGLSEILEKYKNKNIDTHFLHKKYDAAKQLEWGKYLAEQMGLDKDKTRLDISEHPFTTNFSATDVRITTRIDENDFSNNTWSTIHEGGHALYELGLPIEEYGLPLGTFTSLSIHESQSRFWENCVGKNGAFWYHYLPEAQRFFPEQLSEIKLEVFMQAVNRIEPSLIRTEADEVTYHFHIYIRYLIEKELIAGTISTKDISKIWNEKYKELLGIDVPDDKSGCLQDIHWSIGSLGYFPTYSLGSLYAAQFWDKLKSDNPNIESEISNGNLNTTLQWLRQNIHQYGKKYDSEQLCKKVTDSTLDSTIFLKYLEDKFSK